MKADTSKGFVLTFVGLHMSDPDIALHIYTEISYLSSVAVTQEFAVQCWRGQKLLSPATFRHTSGFLERRLGLLWLGLACRERHLNL